VKDDGQRLLCNLDGGPLLYNLDDGQSNLPQNINKDKNNKMQNQLTKKNNNLKGKRGLGGYNVMQWTFTIEK
jgi:hypothetical protein